MLQTECKNKGVWRNGRRYGLKIRCSYERASSSLVTPTKKLVLKSCSW